MRFHSRFLRVVLITFLFVFLSAQFSTPANAHQAVSVSVDVDVSADSSAPSHPAPRSRRSRLSSSSRSPSALDLAHRLFTEPELLSTIPPPSELSSSSSSASNAELNMFDLSTSASLTAAVHLNTLFASFVKKFQVEYPTNEIEFRRTQFKANLNATWRVAWLANGAARVGLHRWLDRTPQEITRMNGLKSVSVTKFKQLKANIKSQRQGNKDSESLIKQFMKQGFAMVKKFKNRLGLFNNRKSSEYQVNEVEDEEANEEQMDEEAEEVELNEVGGRRGRAKQTARRVSGVVNTPKSTIKFIPNSAPTNPLPDITVRKRVDAVPENEFVFRTLPSQPDNLPESLDWRLSIPFVVKDQGTQCGGCYAFAISTILEVEVFRKLGRMIPLSEQMILDCTGGCDGSDTRAAVQALTGKIQYPIYRKDSDNKINGLNEPYQTGIALPIPSRDRFPYQSASTAQCPYDPVQMSSLQFRLNQLEDYNRELKRPWSFTVATPALTEHSVLISNLLTVDIPDTVSPTQGLKSMLKYGPFVGAICAAALYSYVPGSIITKQVCDAVLSIPQFTESCRVEGVDHAIVVVGYGIDRVLNPQKPIPYWIIMNNWGTSFGDQGFLKLEMGTNACNFEEVTSTLLFSVDIDILSS